MQNSQLTKLLLANSAHEVRTPLNAIINYLEIALEGQLDQETRDNISRSHSASKSLIYVINDLLDLTKTEEGQDLIKDEIFDLPATIREAADAFRGDAKRKGLDFQVIEHQGFPQDVCGDQRRTRQAIANLIANAVQHTSTGWVHVEMWVQDEGEEKVTVEVVIADSGAGISKAKLDSLFRELEQVSDDGDHFGFTDDANPDQRKSEPSSSRTLGLGLAMVARHVRNTEGQLRLKSDEGQGSRFVIQLPFTLPAEAEVNSDKTNQPPSAKQSTKGSRSSRLSVTLPPPDEGERTLVDNASASKTDDALEKDSFEEGSIVHSFRSSSSTRSGKSGKSNKSGKSDVDRLIDAIAQPLHVGEAAADERNLQRSSSRGSMKSKKSSNSLTNKTPGTVPSDRPIRARRSTSYSGAVDRLRSPGRAPAGSEYITDSKTLMSAIRMPDEFSEENTSGNSGQHGSHQSASRVMFDSVENGRHDAKYLRTLVAEDDPINSKIIRKRLEKSGHEVYHTMNGEECARAYGERPTFFDVVLMDMQVS